MRVVELLNNYVSLCPFASRVPYEIWIMPRQHESSFERSVTSRSGQLDELAGLIRRTLQRVMSISESFHLVLHTVPKYLPEIEHPAILENRGRGLSLAY